MFSSLSTITAPLIGLVVVVAAYCLGMYLAIKCCRPSDSLNHGGDLFDPRGDTGGVDIFIVSRSDDYIVSMSRQPQTGVLSSPGQRNDNLPAVVPAPAYEEPPTYEDCLRNGLA